MFAMLPHCKSSSLHDVTPADTRDFRNGKFLLAIVLRLCAVRAGIISDLNGKAAGLSFTLTAGNLQTHHTVKIIPTQLQQTKYEHTSEV